MQSTRKFDFHQILARLALFRELSETQLARVAAGTRKKRLAKAEMLFNKGDAPHGFYVIVFGQIKLAFPSSLGHEKVVEIVGAGQSFGEAVMFMDRPYPVFAEALADTLVLDIAKDTVFDLLERDPLFARRMLAGLSLRLHSLLQDVESYSQRSSVRRVIGYLLQHCQDPDGRNATIALPTSKQLVASRLNLTPETLSRIFRELVDDGLIDVQGKKITLRDLGRLRELVL